MSKPNKDGWIRHRGGKCPVEAGTLVDVRTRYDGEFFGAGAITGWAEDWSHTGDGGDIMAWRPHKPEFSDKPCGVAYSKVCSFEGLTDPAEQPNVIGFIGVEEIPVQTEKEGPIQWRDRIREIDATTIALNEERASLVAKLKAEGFVLIQSDEPNGAAGSAQQDIAQQDMSDWRNWKRGDLVECVTVPRQHKGFYEAGKHYAVDSIDLDDAGTSYEVDIHCDSGFTLWNSSSDFKWHSRPPQ